MTDRDRLIELIGQAKIEITFFTSDGEPVTKSQRHIVDRAEVKELADYLLANGVIVPPCKVGDWVYVVSQGQGLNLRWNVYDGKVVDIHLNRHNELTVRVENGEKFFGYYKPCFIHKTKEEAEEKLKGLNNNG